MTKILLVEDDKSLREIYGVRLLAEGYDIVSAGDGEEALAMAIKDRPNLIVSDVMMPKISGFDMLDILRSTTETKDIKVIMMTALSSEDQRSRGEQLGADRYLVKSQVGIEDVVRTVHEVLGDAPTTSAPAAAPSSSAASQPQTAPPAAAPSPQYTSSVPAPAPASDSAPTALRTAPPRQTTPQTDDQPAQNSMPQPTAPFSTNRPASLGERVIHPIEKPVDNSQENIAARISEELSALDETSPASQQPDQPAAPQMPPQPPTPPSAPTPPASPAPAAPTAPERPETPSGSDSTPQASTAPSSDQQNRSSDLDYEATPRSEQQPPTPPAN